MADRKQLILRVGFLALLAGGLLLWADFRMPRSLSIVIDLADALPGDVREVDAVVTREGRLLTRVDRRYGAEGAPQKIAVDVRARPGLADVETTLVYARGPAARSRGAVELREGEPSTVRVKPSR